MSIKVDERFAVCSQPNGRPAAFLVNKRDSMYPTIARCEGIKTRSWCHCLPTICCLLRIHAAWNHFSQNLLEESPFLPFRTRYTMIPRDRSTPSRSKYDKDGFHASATDLRRIHCHSTRKSSYDTVLIILWSANFSEKSQCLSGILLSQTHPTRTHVPTSRNDP